MVDCPHCFSVVGQLCIRFLFSVVPEVDIFEASKDLPSILFTSKHEEHIHGVYTGHETMSLLGLGLVMALIYIVIVRDIILYVLTNLYHDSHITILLNVLFCSSHVSFALSALYKFFTRVPASHGQEFSGHSVMISSALGVY